MNDSVYLLLLCFFAFAVLRVAAASRRQGREVQADGASLRVESCSSGKTAA
jgi:hypothetical protein